MVAGPMHLVGGPAGGGRGGGGLNISKGGLVLANDHLVQETERYILDMPVTTRTLTL